MLHCYNLLKQLNEQLCLRAQHCLHSRNPGDDGQGSHSASTHSFIDDTFVFLPYEDLLTFIRDFKELGPPLGIKLNHTNTKIFTTTSTQPSPSLISPTQHTQLHRTLSKLSGP
jgi:hypothetical protein